MKDKKLTKTTFMNTARIKCCLAQLHGILVIE